MSLDYQALYERHAALAASDEEIVGGCDFDRDFERVGALELAALREAGLHTTDTLVDFGCGVGRLALHAVPFLQGGRYVGIEIAEPILQRAEQLVAAAHPDPPCELTWLHHVDTTFPLADVSVDMVCAFSVFTHMEHEDTYRYLVDAHRVVRPGGRLMFSCFPLGETRLAAEVFTSSAALPLAERWRQVRSVVTSRDLMDAISTLAGWQVERWYAGDHVFSPPAAGQRPSLVQSVCVLERGSWTSPRRLGFGSARPAAGASQCVPAVSA